MITTRDFCFQMKRAIVIGASSGIGRQNRGLEEQIELQTVTTNGLGFTRMVGTAYRYMAAHRGGHIAVISSIAGTKGLGPAPSYSATKAFQNTYIQSLEQLANAQHLNIRFTDLRPGFVATDLLGDDPYPLLLDKKDVAHDMVSSIELEKITDVCRLRREPAICFG